MKSKGFDAGLVQVAVKERRKREHQKTDDNRLMQRSMIYHQRVPCHPRAQPNAQPNGNPLHGIQQQFPEVFAPFRLFLAATPHLARIVRVDFTAEHARVHVDRTHPRVIRPASRSPG